METFDEQTSADFRTLCKMFTEAVLDIDPVSDSYWSL